ncbi:MAG: hypothetical protein KAJ03_04345 [Gammaproteobacteria bacterium]|nr:hypothetical protein [Gammaproteobacteria bacterium]
MLKIENKIRSIAEDKLSEVMRGIEPSAVYDYHISMTYDAETELWTGTAEMDFHVKSYYKPKSSRARTIEKPALVDRQTRTSMTREQHNAVGRGASVTDELVLNDSETIAEENKED